MDVNARTRIATATAARDASDWSRTITDLVAGDFATGEVILAARKLRVFALAVLDRAVLAERAAGATWAEIALAHGLPEAEIINRYRAPYDRWVESCQEPGRVSSTLPAVRGDLAVGLVSDVDLLDSAHVVDQWRDRHRDPWEDTDAHALAAFVVD